MPAPWIPSIVAHVRRALQRARTALRRWSGRELRERPSVRCRTARLGAGDGEWTIAEIVGSEPKVVYSFGVGKDLRFERDLLSRYDAAVFAFDPTPVSVRWVRAQRLPDGLTFREWGLAGRDGSARFHLPDGNNVSFVMGDGDIEVPVRKLETIMRELGHTRVDILKMDIEGAEYDAVADIAALRPDVGQILVEFHHRMPGRTLDDTARAIRALRSAGYEIFHISPRGTEYAFVRRDGAPLQ